MLLIDLCNNLFRDLLSEGGLDETLDIKMAQDGSVYVPGLTWRRVDTLDDVSKVVEQDAVFCCCPLINERGKITFIIKLFHQIGFRHN